MLFGWGDRAAFVDHPTWAPRKGLYRENGLVNGAMLAVAQFRDSINGVRQEGPDRIKWEIRNHMNSYCLGSDYGVTLPKNMDRAQLYLNPHTGATLSTSVSPLSIPSNALTGQIAHHIANLDRPAIMGIGFWEH
jgi:hypothetical protein